MRTSKIIGKSYGSPRGSQDPRLMKITGFPDALRINVFSLTTRDLPKNIHGLDCQNLLHVH